MPSPASPITDRERGLHTGTSLATPSLAPDRAVAVAVEPAPPEPDLGQATNRLAAVYEAVQRRSWLPLTGTATPGRADNYFYVILGDVYSTSVNLGERDRLYRADFDLVTAAIETASFEWAVATLSDHSDELGELEAEMTSAPVLAALMTAADDYVERLERIPTNYVVVDLPTVAQPADALDTRITVEDPATLRRREQQALSAVDNPYLAVLLHHPLRRTILRDLHVAKGPEAAMAVLRRLFAEAQSGINGLKRALYTHRSSVWRYPPMVAGGLTNLGLAANEPLMRYALGVAHLKSGSDWDTALLVAGVALAAAGLVVSGPVGWGILAADFAAARMSAYESYALARDNEAAEAASAFRAGAPFTDRHVGYEHAALAGAAALIVGAAMMRGLFQLLRRTPRLAAAPAAALGPRRPLPLADDRGRLPGSRAVHTAIEVPRLPPAEATRRRKVAGLEDSETSVDDITSPEARGLVDDARGTGQAASGFEQLDLQAATSRGGRKPGGRKKRSTRRAAGTSETGAARPPREAPPALPLSWPHVTQRAPNWCGAASGEMAARRLGVEVTQEQIAATGLMDPPLVTDGKTIRTGGFQPPQLASALELVAPVPGRYWRGGAVARHQALTSASRIRDVMRGYLESTDASVLLMVRGRQHWIVVDEVTADGLIAIRDPAARAPALVTADEVLSMQPSGEAVFSFPLK